MPQPTVIDEENIVKTGSDYHDQKNVAMITPEGTFTARTSEHGRGVARAIVADPLGAVKAYAKITGRCGVCNRKLEDPDSVAAGIGPICAQGF